MRRLAFGRSAPRQLGKRATCHGPQPFQRDVSFFRALHEFFSNILSALMVAAVRQTPADFLKHDVHVRCGPFFDFVFDFGHLTPGSRYQGRLSMPINRRKSQPPSVHLLAKAVGILPGRLADETITPAGLHIGQNLPSNVFIESNQAFIPRI